MDNEKVIACLNYAIKTEIEAVDLYRKLAKRLPDVYKHTLVHILKEEKEHIEELSAMLKHASKQQNIS